MATTPDHINVYVTTRFIRPDDVRKLRDLLADVKAAASDRDLPYIVGCIAGVEGQVDGMFGVEGD